MPNHPLQLPHQHQQQQQQQQQPAQVNLFQPHNLSPNLIKTETKINTSINNPPQHVLINFSENNNNLQMLRAQKFTKNANDADSISFNKQAIKNDEISDHIDSVINDVVNGHGSIPTNIHDFEEEETNSSFKDAMFNSEDPNSQHFNESESNSNFGFHLNSQLQQQPVKNSKKKNGNKNVRLIKHIIQLWR